MPKHLKITIWGILEGVEIQSFLKQPNLDRLLSCFICLLSNLLPVGHWTCLKNADHWTCFDMLVRRFKWNQCHDIWGGSKQSEIFSAFKCRGRKEISRYLSIESSSALPSRVVISHIILQINHRGQGFHYNANKVGKGGYPHETNSPHEKSILSSFSKFWTPVFNRTGSLVIAPVRRSVRQSVRRSFSPSLYISVTAHTIFLKFCRKLDNDKVTKVTWSDFWKKILSGY